MKEMNLSEGCLELFKSECRKKKIRQREIASEFNIAPATCQRILSGESAKLKEALFLANGVTHLTGKLPFQLLETDISNNSRLKLIDKITKLSDSEIRSIENYIELLDTNPKQGKTLFSQLHRAEAFAMISRLYHKIIKVNLTDDSFEPIEVYSKEWSDEMHNSSGYKLSEWIEHFTDSDAVHPDHKQIFREYANIPCLKNIMRLTEIDCTLEYLRLIGSEYRWVSMEVMRSTEYTPENQIILICIKDIQNYHNF